MESWSAGLASREDAQAGTETTVRRATNPNDTRHRMRNLRCCGIRAGVFGGPRPIPGRDYRSFWRDAQGKVQQSPLAHLSRYIFGQGNDAASNCSNIVAWLNSYFRAVLYAASPAIPHLETFRRRNPKSAGSR